MLNKKRFLSVLFSCIFISNPYIFASDITPDTSSSNSPFIETAPNGYIPVINIVKPNEQGLSHNKFKDYSVDKDGIILNNSNQIVNTQLAGHIMNNPNFGLGDTAKVILNEITGTKKSELLGYTEVAGDRADVIIANPNGIYVNGGGFINVNAATLTTGDVIFKDGMLYGFDVNRGGIEINGLDFNANNIDRVNLYSKTLSLNAKLYANNLNIVLGDNEITKEGIVTPKNTQGVGLSLDSFMLGGIYANAIFLTSSDKGVGVNLPPEILAADTLTLNANGDIIVNTIASGDKVSIVSSDDITLNSNRSINANIIELQARNLYNDGEINALSGQNTSGINITNSIINNALIGGYDLNIYAKDITNGNDSALYAKNTLDINANSLMNEKTGYIISGSNAYFNIKESFYNEGDIYSRGDLYIGSLEQRAGNITNFNGAAIESHGNISIFANELNNMADAPKYETVIANKTSWSEYPSGKRRNDITVTATVENLTIPNTPSLILSDSSISIDTNNLTNAYSLIAANEDIVINADKVKNIGKIAVAEVITDIIFNEKKKKRWWKSYHWYNTGSVSYVNTTRSPAINYGIQAGKTITGNIVNLENIIYHIDDPAKEEEIKANQEKIEILKGNLVEFADASSFLNDLKYDLENADEDGYKLFEIEDFLKFDEESLFNDYKEIVIGVRDGYQELLDNNLLALENLQNSLEKLKASDEYEESSIQLQAILESKIDSIKANIQISQEKLNSLESIYAVFNQEIENDKKLLDILSKENIEEYSGVLLSVNNEIKDLMIENTDILSSENFFDKTSSLYLTLQEDTNNLIDKVNQDIAQYGSIEDKIITEDGNDGLYKIGSQTALNIASFPSFSEVTINGITLPSGRYGEFIANQNQNYLIELNPLYADFGTFIGSSYLQDRLNFNQEEAFKRLGDGMYETRLIRDAIIRQTGNRYLEGYYSDTEQFQALMDNALSVHEDLQLTYGAALTYEQIAGLTKDIVWMEEKEVWGEKVLVPVLYLAVNNINNYGPKITTVKGDINLNTNEITNKGVISSGGNLNVVSNTITNTQGVISSDNNMNIYTKESLLNQSGTFISGNDMNIVSDGTITSESLTDTLTYGYYEKPRIFGIPQAEAVFVTTQTDTLMGLQGQFISGGNVNIAANDNIVLLNTNVIANNDANIFSNKDITIGSMEERDEYNFNFKGGFNKGLDIINHGSNIQGSNINIGANNIVIDTSNLNADNLIYLNAKENVDILARNDVTYRDFQSTQKGFASKTTTREMSYHENTISSTLNADNILISSEGAVTLEAAKLKANDNIYIDAKANINVVAKVKKDAELYMKSKSSWGGLKKSLDLNENEAFTLSSSDIETIAENIVFKSGDDINIIASDINSASDLQLEAFDNVLIAAGIEKSASKEIHESSSFNPFNLIVSLASGGLITESIYHSDMVKDTLYDTTAKSSNLNSGNNIIIKSGSTDIVGSNLEAYNNIAIKADTGHINIVTAEELVNAAHEEKHIDVSLANIKDMVQGLIDNEKKGEDRDTKIKIQVASASYDESESIASATNHVGSSLTTNNGNIILDAFDDIRVTGSNLSASNGAAAFNSQIGNVI
ncbi:MAG: filamentous hemagglutinin N-terminal domain-containing protein, partial [Campylobacteraceae bacterium]|nr:filamentous hemagglutinin N-terminal domain-containing protein [Campylobacteraceae bacterium]